MMKNFFVLTTLVVVTSVFSAFSANAQVINPQAQSSTKVVQFWVGDEIFFRWTGKELIVTRLVLEGPVMLHQGVLLEDGSFKSSHRNIHIDVYNPATDWKNEVVMGPVEISFRPYTIQEKNYTVHGNNRISLRMPDVYLDESRPAEMGWEILAYDVKIEKGKITLRIHKMLWVNEKNIYDKIIHEEVFII